MNDKEQLSSLDEIDREFMTLTRRVLPEFYNRASRRYEQDGPVDRGEVEILAHNFEAAGGGDSYIVEYSYMKGDPGPLIICIVKNGKVYSLDFMEYLSERIDLDHAEVLQAMVSFRAARAQLNEAMEEGDTEKLAKAKRALKESLTLLEIYSRSVVSKQIFLLEEAKNMLTSSVMLARAEAARFNISLI